MEKQNIKQKEVKKILYFANCKYCDKYLEHFSLGSLTYNLSAHERMCKLNPENKDKK